MKIVALCDQDTAVGLRLAGITTAYVVEKNAQKLWTEIVENHDIGIVLITESIIESLGRELKEFRLKRNIPIILEIPDKTGRKADHIDYVSQLIKKAVGVEVSKEK